MTDASACDPTDPACTDATATENTTEPTPTSEGPTEYLDKNGGNGSMAALILGILMLINTATPIVYWAAYRYNN